MNFFYADEVATYNSIDHYDVISGLSLDDVEKFLLSLGIDVEKHPDFLICQTICHNPIDEAASRKLYYYNENHSFHCYTECGDNFSIFELYRKYMSLNHYEISIEEAEDYIKKFFLEELEKFPITKQKRKTYVDFGKYQINIVHPRMPVYPDFLPDIFVKYYHPTWLREGISKEVMDRFKIRFSLYQNKIIIPHYDIFGELIGIRTRAFEEEDIADGKYKPLIFGGQMYNHLLGYNLYGIYEHKEAIQKFRRVIIYESEKSVLKDETYYGENSVAVAVCGSNLNKFQVSLLVRQLDVNEIVLAFDKEYDRCNTDEGRKYKEKLRTICEKYNHLADFSFIYDERGFLKKKDAPIDVDRETLEKLYKLKIKVK